MTSRLMRLLALVVAVATLGLVGGVGAGSASAAPPGQSGKTVQITGTSDNGGTFTGTFTTKSAKADPSAPKGVAVVGDLTGQLTGQPGNPQGQGRGTQDVNRQDLALPVSQVQQAGCEILDLVLGPLDLNLLGLQVHLDTVHLNITAVPGAGNLLGNLLCAIAGLLDPSGNITDLLQFVNLLNQLLGLLG